MTKDETDQIIRSKQPNIIYGHRGNISNLSGSCGPCNSHN